MSRNKFDLRHKEALTLFLEDFFRLFFPEIAPKINFETVNFLDKEMSALFTDPESHADRENRTDALIMAEITPYQGKPARIILIHWEQSSEKQTEFDERMYHYGCGIYYKFRKPVFPVAMFTDKAKWRVRVPDFYEVKLFGKTFASYGYNQIKLKDYSAEAFEEKIAENPLAAAYLPLTDYPADRRPEIKARAVKGVANVEQGKKQATLVSLIDVSLSLDMAEEKKYKELIWNDPEFKEVKMLASVEEIGIEKGMEKGIGIGMEKGMGIGMEKGMGIGMEKGMEKGEKGGKSNLILRQFNKKFGASPPELDRILRRFDADVLDRFGEAIFDFENIADAEKWWNDPKNIGNA